MKISVPFKRPEQLSIFGKKRHNQFRHRWKDVFGMVLDPFFS
jgi:hypothetical protein